MYSANPGISGDTRFQQLLKKWAFAFALAALLISLLVLAGWQFNIGFLKSPLAYRVSMNPVTAVALLLAAVSFLILSGINRRYQNLQSTGKVLAVLTGIIGLGKLLNSLFIIDAHIDHLLFYRKIVADTAAGHLSAMAPNSALCLLLTGLACLLLPVRSTTGKAPAQYLALVVGAVAFFSVLGYLYRVQAFYGILVYIPMAIHTAISFLLLSLAILFATPDKGLMKTFTGVYAGSMVSRFLLPAVIIVPVVFGLLRLYGYWTGIFTTEFGVAVLVLSIILFFLGLTWYTVRLLNNRDMEKEAAALALQKSEAETKYQALLLQNISDAMISTDIDFRILSWNKAAEEMYGWTEQEVMGKPISTILDPVYDQVSREEVLSAYFKNGYWKGEVGHQKKNGDLLSVLVSTTVIQKEGVNTGTLAVIRDITAIKRAKQKFRDLLNAAPDATVIVNSRGLIEMVNKQAEDLFQYKRDELLGNPVEMLMPLVLKEAHSKHIQKYVKEHRVRPMGAGMELQARQKDGTLFPVEISLSPLETEDGLLVSASIRDITERRKIEQRLKQFNEELEQQVHARTLEIQESEKKYRTLVEEAVDGITVFSLDTMRCLEANKKITELLDYSHAELMEKHITDFFSEEELRRQPMKLEPLRQGTTVQVERNLTKRDGTIIQVEANAKPLENGRVLVFIRDIRERKVAEEKILQINEQLRQLSARLEEVREQERIRISREIHDELGQQLTGLKMDIAWLSKKATDNEEPVRKKFAGALALTDEMVRTVRRISTELRPAVLDDLGLAAAIEWQSAEFEKRFNIKVQLVVPDNNLVIPIEKVTGLFRIYQEALTNVARHAQATVVKSTLCFNEAGLMLTVADNGKGFDVQKAGAGKTLGLLGMRERVIAMGGKYDITAKTGTGTTITVTIPL
jgi:PAS domain S-box-containing protein